MPVLILVMVGAIILLLFVPLFTYNAETAFGPAMKAPAFPRAPFTWGDLFNALGTALHRFTGWLYNAIMPVVHALWAWMDSHRQLLEGLGVHVEAQHGLNVRITGTYIPGAVHHADAVGAAAVQQSADYADTLHSDSIAYTEATGKADQAYARALAQAEEAFALQLQQQSEAFALQLQRQALNYAQQLSAGDRALSEQLQAQALSYAQAVGLEAEQYARALLGQAENFIQAEVKTLEGYIESVQQADTDYTRQAVGSATAPLAAGLTIAQAAISELENSECMKFCNPLGGLGAALEAIDLAALLALVADAYRDPGGASKLVSELLGPVAQAGEDALKAVTGGA